MVYVNDGIGFTPGVQFFNGGGPPGAVQVRPLSMVSRTVTPQPVWPSHTTEVRLSTIGSPWISGHPVVAGVAGRPDPSVPASTAAASVEITAAPPATRRRCL